MFKNVISGYRKSSIKPPRGAKKRLGVGGGGGLFNLAKKMVSVLHKELEGKVEKLKYKTLEVRKQIRTSSW